MLFKRDRFASLSTQQVLMNDPAFHQQEKSASLALLHWLILTLQNTGWFSIPTDDYHDATKTCLKHPRLWLLQCPISVCWAPLIQKAWWRLSVPLLYVPSFRIMML